MTESEFDQVKGDFEIDWPRYATIGTDAGLLHRAAEMVDAFALRAYDGVHLAAAEYVSNGVDDPVTFACYDRQLGQAAAVLRLRLIGNIGEYR